MAWVVTVMPLPLACTVVFAGCTEPGAGAEGPAVGVTRAPAPNPTPAARRRQRGGGHSTAAAASIGKGSWRRGRVDARRVTLPFVSGFAYGVS